MSVGPRNLNTADAAHLENRLRLVLETTGVSTWEIDVGSRLISLDANGTAMLGVATESIDSFLKRRHLAEPETSQIFSVEDTESGSPVETTVRLRDIANVYRCFSCLRVVSDRDEAGNPTRFLGTLRNVDADVKSHQLLQLERDVLSRLAGDTDVQTSLGILASGIDSIWEDVRCAINLHDPLNATLHIGSAPNLPEVYTQTVEGFHLGSLPTVCGLAIEQRSFVHIPDFADAPKAFDESLPFYEQLNVKGCWSMPVFVGDQILATCCIFTLAPRRPTSAEVIQLERLAQAVGLLIQGHRQKREQAALDAKDQHPGPIGRTW